MSVPFKTKGPLLYLHHTALGMYRNWPGRLGSCQDKVSPTIKNQSGYSSMTGRVPLQAIRPVLNDFRVGFTSMVGVQATKG